ncbi:MAG: aminoacyl-tRNA hydrolase [Defluviitaleaceae bacterium]|nr:aminoacyl-tRNA hydrolase [Defluviitaleaceae bacterium]
MLIIAGLGNPEKDYRNTRHNIGFETLNKFVYDHNLAFNKAKFRSHIAEGVVFGKKILLLKPQTYMNLSGEAIRDALIFYKLEPENLIVIYDDIALDVGEVRIRKQGSAGSHNGMKSIVYQLECDVFTRIRVGIGAKPPGYTLSNYVLSRFSKNETEAMIEGVTKATDALEIILKDSVDTAMNKFNKKKKPEKPPKTEEVDEQ